MEELVCSIPTAILGGGVGTCVCEKQRMLERTPPNRSPAMRPPCALPYPRPSCSPRAHVSNGHMAHVRVCRWTGGWRWKRLQTKTTPRAWPRVHQHARSARQERRGKIRCVPPANPLYDDPSQPYGSRRWHSNMAMAGDGASTPMRSQGGGGSTGHVMSMSLQGDMQGAATPLRRRRASRCCHTTHQPAAVRTTVGWPANRHFAEAATTARPMAGAGVGESSCAERITCKKWRRGHGLWAKHGVLANGPAPGAPPGVPNDVATWPRPPGPEHVVLASIGQHQARQRACQTMW